MTRTAIVLLTVNKTHHPSTMSKILDGAATIVLVCAAIAVGGSVVHREFRSANAAPARGTRGGAPVAVPDWQRFAAVGNWIGDSTAKVVIVEFADFECPFCKRFHERFQNARDSLGGDVALLLVQYPIDGHRFARPAALAAECAAEQGRWAAFHNQVFDKQDSLGLKPWVSFARDAGIADTVTFSSCVARKGRSSRIDAAIVAANSINITGTPTVLINGMRYPMAPYDSLVEIVRHQVRAAK